tara:strand:- start:407 stop:1057 length:651 start_codon:yes stop_codon:yes gene_type:complete
MIIYGEGKVIIDDIGKAFEIKYQGSIQIIDSPDNLFISANQNKIIGFMMNAQNMPSEIFSYRGNFKILNCRIVNNNKYIYQKIKTQGVDFWNIDTEKWESDESTWGSKNKNDTYGTVSKINLHDIVVNNNIKTEFSGQYLYKNGDPVPSNTLIHIHGDGVVMTGGVHTKDSVEIYFSKGKKPITRQQISQIRQTTTTPSMIPSTVSGSSTSGGGGY